MKHPITAETLFEEFVEQIETAVDVVATQVPYTRQQIVSIAFTSVENAGIYYDGVKEWRRKDTSDKTWEALKTFFAREFQDIRIQPRTSVSKGYGAHCMRGGQANAAVMENMQQQQSEALANLATSTAADKQAVTALSSSNATLTNELRAATATIATLQQRLASFCALQHHKQGQEDSSGDNQANNANIIRAATQCHWIQTDTVGRTDIASARGTNNPRATTPCQDTRAQPSELIRWEEA